MTEQLPGQSVGWTYLEDVFIMCSDIIGNSCVLFLARPLPLMCVHRADCSQVDWNANMVVIAS